VRHFSDERKEVNKDGGGEGGERGRGAVRIRTIYPKRTENDGILE
jgi:hypothetical protein